MAYINTRTYEHMNMICSQMMCVCTCTKHEKNIWFKTFIPQNISEPVTCINHYASSSAIIKFGHVPPGCDILSEYM